VETADTKRLCSKCWSEITDEDEEASYLGVTVETLRTIRFDDRWGNRVLSYGEKRKKKRKKAVRLRGNRFVKFYDR
tara:strand:+ start:2627 stop:2854 length:228 start_codon:yes stop_codon:yes gene_type:complete